MNQYNEIPKEEVKAGDYAYIDGDSSFCTGGWEKITAIETRYRSVTGEPYKVIRTADGCIYNMETGKTIRGASAYSVFDYGRESSDRIEQRKRLKSLKAKRAVLYRKINKEIDEAVDGIVKKHGIENLRYIYHGTKCNYFDTEYDKEIVQLTRELDLF